MVNKNIKSISFLPAGDVRVGSSRLRVLSLIDLFKKAGIQCAIGYDSDSDLVLVQKRCNQEIIEIVTKAKLRGAKIVYDFDDIGAALNFYASKDEINRLLPLVDGLTADTVKNGHIFKRIYMPGKPLFVVPNPIDYYPDGPLNGISDDEIKGIDKIRIVWFGSASTFKLILPIFEKLSKNPKLCLTAISDSNQIQWAKSRLPNLRIEQWCLQNFVQLLTSNHICVLNHTGDLFSESKCNNKLITSINYGVPSIVSNTPEYSKLLAQCGLNKFIFNCESEIDAMIDQLLNYNVRRDYLDRSQKIVWELFNPHVVAKSWLDVFSEICKNGENNDERIFRRNKFKNELGINEKDERKLSISYIFQSVQGVTGGNQTLLGQVNYLVNRGHNVSVVTYSDKPRRFNLNLNSRFIKVPAGESLARYVPKSDIVIATYFINAFDLSEIDSGCKIYQARGDQFVFNDADIVANDKSALLFKKSCNSYSIPGVKVIANSKFLAETIRSELGGVVEAVIPVCVDLSVFRPLTKSITSKRKRILVVGPDGHGSDLEPLKFKGMSEIRLALTKLWRWNQNFINVVRMSSSPPLIFKDFPCDFYMTPSEELKTFLYGTADILVYASYYDSCPRPPLEAMAAGVAVICTDTGGAREYCVDGENCILVKSKSVDEIFSALKLLIESDDIREHIVHGGFRTASQRSQEREWLELEDLLQNLV